MGELSFAVLDKPHISTGQLDSIGANSVILPDFSGDISQPDSQADMIMRDCGV